MQEIEYISCIYHTILFFCSKRSFIANQSQYDLDREAATISALPSNELDKYEYLTGEDLGYKPGVVEQAKLDILYWERR